MGGREPMTMVSGLEGDYDEGDPMTILQKRQVIRDTIELLGPVGENWTKGSWARDAEGIVATIESDDACKFCVGGALTLVARRLGLSANSDFMDEVVKLAGGTGKSIVLWNDSCEWDQIRDGLRLALENI